jgi:hypothetical protein
MSDARSVILKVLHGYSTKDSYIDWELSDADAILAALAVAGFVITTRERWDALVRVAEGIERVVASKALEGSE